MDTEPTLISQIVAWIIGIVAIGIFAYLYNLFLDLITKPYEHSDEVKRWLGEK